MTAEGDFVIADRGNGRVQLCPAASPGADCETVADAASAGVSHFYPRGVATGADGNLIVVDRSSNRVFRCLAASAASGCDIVAGGSRGSGDMQFNPERILIDAAGDYVIADTLNHRIQLCSGSSPGSPCTTVVGTGTAGSGATELNQPYGLALIADAGNHRLQRCVSGGLCVTVFGGYGTGPAQFYFPTAVVIVNSVTTTVSTTLLPTSTSATSSLVSTQQATAAVASGEHISKLSFALSALMMAILVDVWICCLHRGGLAATMASFAQIALESQ